MRPSLYGLCWARPATSMLTQLSGMSAHWAGLQQLLRLWCGVLMLCVCWLPLLQLAVLVPLPVCDAVAVQWVAVSPSAAWDAPSSWNTSSVPGALDAVYFVGPSGPPVSTTVTVTMSASQYQVAELHLSGMSDSAAYLFTLVLASNATSAPTLSVGRVVPSRAVALSLGGSDTLTYLPIPSTHSSAARLTDCPSHLSVTAWW